MYNIRFEIDKKRRTYNIQLQEKKEFSFPFDPKRVLSRLLKYGCLMASFAEIRLGGSYSKQRFIRSIPSDSAFACPTKSDDKSFEFQLGKLVLNSGNALTPGHICSLGVPKILHMNHPSELPKQDKKMDDLLEDLVKLIDFGVARKQRFSSDHFIVNAANGPDIDRTSIILRSQQDFR